MITGSDLTADRKHLVTVSLDFMLKVSFKERRTVKPPHVAVKSEIHLIEPHICKFSVYVVLLLSFTGLVLC